LYEALYFKGEILHFKNMKLCFDVQFIDGYNSWLLGKEALSKSIK
jgi:hypothetical protein